MFEKRWTDFFTQIPQPMHRNSEMNAILSVDFTSMQSLPRISISWSNPPVHLSVTFLHSWAHRFGLQRFESTMAIRVILSAIFVIYRGRLVSIFCSQRA
ncbi:hypothetical protein K503DRAFT_681475 [Rhizopogon vinicolor AM-OR11-026]|uniref:Uncharacterized protein n=1 Tax=Rhizopogon vinicolor AM-OR11-026 TaxID=1314800 RepID=A0A1B7NEM9_9AGAM|nr:hypothetical protein K503DRAFT_681475 [Rhizopogon vinicolor AM-OR11-026]